MNMKFNNRIIDKLMARFGVKNVKGGRFINAVRLYRRAQGYFRGFRLSFQSCRSCFESRGGNGEAEALRGFPQCLHVHSGMESQNSLRPHFIHLRQCICN